MTLALNTDRAADATLRGEGKAEHSESHHRNSFHC